MFYDKFCRCFSEFSVLKTIIIMTDCSEGELIECLSYPDTLVCYRSCSGVSCPNTAASGRIGYGSETLLHSWRCRLTTLTSRTTDRSLQKSSYRQSENIEILYSVYVKGSMGRTDSPVQLWVLQAFCCRPDPKHSLPPLRGSGLSHSRVRILAPPPHWAEHSDQGAHWPQLPSTWQPGTESHCRTPASQVLEKRIKKHTDTEIKNNYSFVSVSSELPFLTFF